jgi:hypothetical protein
LYNAVIFHSKICPPLLPHPLILVMSVYRPCAAVQCTVHPQVGSYPLSPLFCTA